MRRQGWELDLAKYLVDAPAFAWGENDCALWAAGWVYRCAGEDFVTGWRGKYTTEAGARRTMLERGFSGVEAIADAHLEPKPIGLASRGDVVMHPSGALGICNGLFSQFLTVDGVIREKTLACPRAWKVG